MRLMKDTADVIVFLDFEYHQLMYAERQIGETYSISEAR